ncbi:McrC family protein [Methylophilus luteus]|uniref:McrC family protein n=1 Tax=Methylophilus luteus TaxID=640108 RepID=A0ABW3F956_9PROT
MKYVVVREYARLTTDTIEATIDQASVSVSAFEYLCNLSALYGKSGASLLQVENRRWLRLNNHVGVIETPCGTLLEILPKTTKETGDNKTQASRDLLIKMLSVALDLPVRNSDKTNISTFRHSLLEWVMKEFTLAFDQLIKCGVRFDYKRIEDEQRFLRGQLDVTRQMRQPPGKGHIFQINHDLFLTDRPENRLLKSAIDRVCKHTQQVETWRLSHEISTLISDIPQSKCIDIDFKQWSKDRLMAHYQPILPWCELVLSQHMPLSIRGNTQGISLLFPMEKLFERYVEIKIRKQLSAIYSLKRQASSKYLCAHENDGMFRLLPDLLIQRDGQNIAVLDTKWKLIFSTDKTNKYGLNQPDFYQLFAYGHKYLNSNGPLFLIYPLIDTFSAPLPSFDFSQTQELWVIPFDLEKDMLHWPASWDFKRDITTQLNRYTP